MAQSLPNINAHNRMREAFRHGWDIDFIRAKFNVSSKDVENAIRHAGSSREKIIEYLKKIFSGK